MPLPYHMPLFRPPSEADNLIIQVTLGCSFNQCSFCSMYRSKHYVQRALDVVSEEIKIAARRRPDARRVFLADGDALSLPADQVLMILDLLHTALPKLSRVSCYATPGNILAKSHDELVQLKAKGLSLLYLGIESGSDLILKKITKGASQQGIVKAMQKAFDAGLKVSGTVILGLGGKEHWREHIDGTVALLNRAPITYLSTLQLHLEDDIVDEFQTKFGEKYEMQDDRGVLEEQVSLISGLNPPKPVVFRSNHASNALALAGNLPRDKEKLLSQLQAALDGQRPLRPCFIRGM
ncbi:radical SAM protein [Mariprofundus sp. EBB-1]|uniref:radical SAM protein n=1 Tax=Mariprofundus sp. EBB-1 TaxID=2650971 RepID=UPI000EF1C592|nr:radical SAM protein [Mariprofundus sp. EBB-1]